MPGCGRVTVGPGAQTDQYANLGVAAHIYSASPGGPRGNGGLREDELRSAANAIWLCTHHAGLVDKNGSADYPPELLLRYKNIHEARVARELQGASTPLGWITALHVEASPLFAARTAVSLGKLTLFVGNNETGKTALCEWLAGASDVRYLKRWQPGGKARSALHIRVEYLSPDPHSIRVAFADGAFPRYFLDDRYTMIPVAPLKAFYPKDVRLYGATARGNDLYFLMDVLRLTEHEVLALAEEIPGRGAGSVTRVWFEKYDDRCRLYADVKGTVPGLPFANLADSERTRILMEFCILAAKQYAQVQPTLLILDAGAWRLDTDWLSAYAEILGSPDIGFQTIASMVPRAPGLDELQWAGWRVIRLKGKPPGVAITTEIRDESGDA